MIGRVPLVVAFAIGILQAQTPAARPQFEVASIKLNTNCGNGRGGGSGPSPGRLSVPCTTLRSLIQTAYDTFANGSRPQARRLRILGGPGWIDSDRYDIAARAEGNAALVQMAGPMLQVMLEDRFKLQLHRETREVPVYSLTAIKSGLKPRALKEGSCTPIDLNHLGPPAPGQPMPNLCDRQMFGRNGPNMTLDIYAMSMARFSDGLLSSRLDRPVVDKTGLNGRFDFRLEFAPDSATPGFVAPVERSDAGEPAPLSDTAGPSFFTAIQEQLGLKLSPDKGPIEVLVIDHVEKPSGN